ncbi:MAG: hypothetical protein QGD90_06240 [Candidatus Hydrogenedentes bacterium]|nr:hypothetical protein [Candidatus Hydrogenedentota bacterium]
MSEPSFHEAPALPRATTSFVLAPIPGLLIVAYMDTCIAKPWNKAKMKFKDATSI